MEWLQIPGFDIAYKVLLHYTEPPDSPYETNSISGLNGLLYEVKELMDGHIAGFRAYADRQWLNE